MTEEAELLQRIGEQPICLNCGAGRDGVFCRQCGQRFVEGRLSVRGLLRELPARFFSFETGFLATAIALWKGPGRVARCYVLGERRRWANPLAMLLIGASMQLIVLTVITPALKARIAGQVEVARNQSSNSEAFETMEELLGGDAPGRMADLYMATMKQGYTYAAFVFFCLPLALFLTLIRRGDTTPYRMAEHLIFALYLVAQLLVCTAISNLVTFKIHDTLQFGTALTLYLIYGYVAHRGFYPHGAGSAAKTLTAFVLAVTVFFLSLSFIFIATLIGYLLVVKATS